MSYGYFVSYNIIGGIVWVCVFTVAGYLFGNVPFVQDNFTLVVIAIIFVSIVPVLIEALKARREGKQPAPKPSQTS
jgi:membrane-associated protein